MPSTPIVTAAALAIGDELLSGRTKDKNIGYLAETLTAIGIQLKEVRIVADEEAAIVEALNALRKTYDYVFTSGGIGPTHDDITADSISRAFGLACVPDAKAMELMSAHYKKQGKEFTEARQRMARMPEGAHHIDNPVSIAPGFSVGNVFAMAGVPAIFQAMLANVLPKLKRGHKLISNSITCPFGEGDIGTGLRAIAERHHDVSIGSYPRYSSAGFSNEIVLRCADETALSVATLEVQQLLAEMANSPTKPASD